MFPGGLRGRFLNPKLPLSLVQIPKNPIIMFTFRRNMGGPHDIMLKCLTLDEGRGEDCLTQYVNSP